MEQSYSVLMSVYAKEKPEYLRASMESMFAQTVPTDDFVLVCDGPLPQELNDVITQMLKQWEQVLHVVRLPQNVGLGNALNKGLQHCRHDLVARMDSDDISRVDRCERQLAVFAQDSTVDIVSGTIEEFSTSPDQVTGRRVLPARHDEICHFSKKRNPFNHPAIMFKKGAVLAAGNYSEKYPLFEDYYLWVRMLMQGSRGQNIPEPLLYMRTPLDMYKRRGGWRYANDMLHFHRWLHKIGWTNWIDFSTGVIPHVIICILPIEMRKRMYAGMRGQNECIFKRCF